MRSFEQNMVDIYGEKGQQWLDSLPDIIAKLEKEYHLTDLFPVSQMTFNYVASGYQAGTPIVLKVGLNSQALIKEAECLNAFSNQVAVKVITFNDQMILMKRAVPGESLKSHFPNKDVEATHLVSSIIHQLHSATIPQNHNFYYIRDLLNTLDKNIDIPVDVLSKARNLRDGLLSVNSPEVLLHGDLHHDNVLKHNDTWLVIDPKGFVGDPVFEVTAFLANPMPELLSQTDPAAIIQSRVSVFSERLGFEEDKIYQWLFVKSVLCWAWSLEDNLDPSYFRHLTSIIPDNG